MKILIKLVYTTIFTIVFINFTSGYKTLDFNSYFYLIKKINNNLKNISTQKLSKINKIINTLKNNNKYYCNYFIKNDYFYLNPICFLKNYIPIIDNSKLINDGFLYIYDFSKKFDLYKSSFLYTGSNIIWKENYFKNYNDFKNLISNNNTGENIINIILFIKNFYIKIPKQFIYRFHLDTKFSFYVSTKNLYNRGECMKHNYQLAISQLNNLKLLPGEIFNYNKVLANLNNKLYCRELDNKHYLFYGGVCGASSQLFRNSLINPLLLITKRYNHSRRYAKYYSDHIRGDDAALYERIKQFEIKNIGNYTIYFKTFQKSENNIYLVSVIPAKISEKSIVIRKQLGKLKALVGKIVFDKNFKERYSQFWLSNYCCKARTY